MQSRKLKRAQQALSRKVTSSRNRGKARLVVARLHQKIRNQRSDFLHKLSTELIGHNDLISIEDLNVRGLAKGKLAASVLDAGWGMFRAMLAYKAERQDKHLITIGRFFPSSKTCGACGRVNADLALGDREWSCSCGVHHDRDINAARTSIEKKCACLNSSSRQDMPRRKTPVEAGSIQSERLAPVDEAGSRPGYPVWYLTIDKYTAGCDGGAGTPRAGEIRSKRM